MPRIGVIFVSLAILLPVTTGCGNSGSATPQGPEDERQIAEFMSYFNDYTVNETKFKQAFTEKPPSNRKEYEKFRFDVKVGSIKVDGANATAVVEFRNDSSHEVLTTKEWTFTKVGDAWKIKSAPLR